MLGEMAADPWIGMPRPWTPEDMAADLDGAVITGRCNVYLPSQGPNTTSASGLTIRTKDGRDLALYWQRHPSPSGTFVVVPLAAPGDEP
jgi:hypothetical protein